MPVGPEHFGQVLDLSPLLAVQGCAAEIPRHGFQGFGLLC